MNENDKVLINAYFDGELSDDEIKYVENLISSNEAANNYANNIKSANLEIENFFNSSDLNFVSKKIDSFIDNKKSSQRHSLFDNLFNRINIFQSSAFAFTAAFFLFIGYNIDQDEINSFSDLGIEVNVLKLRSGSQSIEQAIENTLDEMIDQKSSTGKLIFGNENFDVSITSISENTLVCFEGVVKNDAYDDTTTYEKGFLYCSSDGLKKFLNLFEF